MLPGEELNRKVWHRDRTGKAPIERDWGTKIFFVILAGALCMFIMRMSRASNLWSFTRFGTVGNKPVYTDGFISPAPYRRSRH